MILQTVLFYRANIVHVSGQIGLAGARGDAITAPCAALSALLCAALRAASLRRLHLCMLCWRAGPESGGAAVGRLPAVE